MSKKSYSEFRKFWLKNYIEQYKNGTRESRKELKENIYKNINLTEDEKDKIWEEVLRWNGYDN